MNTTPSQATTTPTTPRAAVAQTPQSTIEIEGSSVRVDSRSSRHRGPRAQVLKAYAEWLRQTATPISTSEPAGSTSTLRSRFGSHLEPASNVRQTGDIAERSTEPESAQTLNNPPAAPPAHTPEAPKTNSLSREDLTQIDRLFHRIDTAIETTLDRSAAQQTPPHFETRDYVPPVDESTASIAPQPANPKLSERDQDLASDSREPATGIVEHIRELQSQGRLIGELEIAKQLDHARVVRRTVHGRPLPGHASPPTPVANGPAVGAEPSGNVEPCDWPEVTDLLLTRHRVAIDTLGQQVNSVLAPGERRVAVTSTRRREGASTIAMALTRWYAETEQRVLLVDADLTHPDLIAKLTPDCTRSWTKALDDPKQLRHEITATISPNVDLLPLFRLGDNTRWKRPILGHLGDALRRIESDYDRVIINTGPVFQLITEIRSADDLADAFILATAVNRTTDAERLQSQNGLLSVGADKILVAQNFTRR